MRLPRWIERWLRRRTAQPAPPGGRIIREVMDPVFLDRQLDVIATAAQRRPGGPQLAPEHYEQARAELAAAPAAIPLMPRSPVTSILQSTLTTCIESRLERLIDAAPEGIRRLAHAVLGDAEIFREFGPCDPLWIETKLAEGWAMIEGRPPFPDSAAPPVKLARDARLVVVGDWGTGLPGAVQVAAQMRHRLDEARGRQRHAIHLGDVYYSGWKEEYETRFLPHWPVDRDDSEILSWSLNGNHDMYSGGHGYFGYLLRDPRFRGHCGDGRSPSSWFSLENDDWQILGLDSAYADHDLAGGQQQWLAGKLAGRRRTMLLSHHQPFSAYEEVGQKMTDKVRAAVGTGPPLAAWLWGHEHRCSVYADRPAPYLEFGTCIGHGGVPQIMPDPPLVAPPPGEAPWYARLSWRDEQSDAAEGNRWLRFGFAVLDFDGPRVSIEYVDERGRPVHHETLG